jgi:rubrerythrin
MKRSFTDLEPPEVLRIAIFIEQRNAEIYRHFAEMFTEFGDPESLEVAGLFWEMAVEERQHSAMLETRYSERYGDARPPLSEEDVQEFIEVPRLDQEMLAGDKSDVGARDRALQVTLRAEISAQAFYAELAQHTPPGALRDIYEQLALMEDGHIDFLSRKLSSGARSESVH